jgi:hypothetical protein
MSRIEMVKCDVEGCGATAPAGTTGWSMMHFESRAYDFCSAVHQLAFQQGLYDLNPESEEAEAETPV